MRKSTLATLIATSLMLTGCAKSPESTVESFYKAVGKGEMTEAQTYISSQVTGMLGPQKMWAALAQESERVRKCGGIKSIDVKLEGQGEVRSGTAMVTYAGQAYQFDGVLRAISGDGATELLSVAGVAACSGRAAGDIDNDGIIEIVGINGGGAGVGFVEAWRAIR